MNIKSKLFYPFALLALVIGLYPLAYVFTDMSKGLFSFKDSELLSNVVYNVGFYGHILFGGLALFIGWAQFHKKLRAKKLELHRAIGKVYMIAVLISGTCGLYIAFHATGGLIAQMGFGMLAVIWLAVTISAYRYVKSGDIIGHQRMMVYSYAACFSAVMLRLWLPLLIMYFKDFIPAYQIVAWLCWVPNLIVAYFINRGYA